MVNTLIESLNMQLNEAILARRKATLMMVDLEKQIDEMEKKKPK